MMAGEQETWTEECVDERCVSRKEQGSGMLHKETRQAHGDMLTTAFCKEGPANPEAKVEDGQDVDC